MIAMPRPALASQIALPFATYASIGQRTLTIPPEKAPEGTIAVVVIRPRKGGVHHSGHRASNLGAMNAKLDRRGRWDAVMSEDGLFTGEAAP